MDLILCHVTADFDTLGAAVGLTRLHPGARIVLSGGAHPAVRDFLALHRDEYPLIERRSVNPDTIRSLVVVDTQHRSRLGKTAEWLDLPNVAITLYDHHLHGDGDIPTNRKMIEPVGATTTMIAEILQTQGIIPTPVEATVMALGIHVDTGSLTFDHATPRDARALAWLMDQGASLRAIAEYIDPGLSPDLQRLLSLAIEQLQTETVQGYTIAWVLLDLEGYTPGLSSLASRLVDVTELDALLLGAAYCREGECPPDNGASDVLTVIGRSGIEGTDLNQLLSTVGGGGHPRAASANLHQVYPKQVIKSLFDQLKHQIPQAPLARELMSSPVRTIRPETTIDEAQRILLRYGHSGLSVVDAAGTLVGIISRRDLDIALHHGFSHAPVKGYMTTNFKTITPTTALSEIEALMVTYDIGRLPVLDAGRLVGIVTRTDVLRQLHREGGAQRQLEMQTALTKPTPVSLPPFTLLTLLRQCLKPELWNLLLAAAQEAEQRGWQLYLVGGAVRDLLLAISAVESATGADLLIDDIDLVVDGFDQAADGGAGVELARSLQQLYPQSRLEIHGKFQTAALLWHHDPDLDSLWMDIATARTEFYPYPAANPEVEASSIRQDLYRRDFTINALAIRLTQPHAGEILDYFGGLLDLQSRQIRVLHANSFIEDPTRMYRAVRFAVRLGFDIDDQTEGYIRTAIASGIYRQVQTELGKAPALQTRLKAELRYILQSPYWKPALEKLADLGALQCIHPDLVMDDRLWRQLRLVERWLQWAKRLQSPAMESSPINRSLMPLLEQPSWLLLLEVLLAALPARDRGIVATKLQLPADSIDRLTHLEACQTQIHQRLPHCERPSQIAALLQTYDSSMLILVALRSDRWVRRAIWRYLTDWSRVQPVLDGHDLKQMGYKPGRQFKTMLEALCAASLDGQIQTPAAAKTFVLQHFPLEGVAQPPEDCYQEL